MPYEIDNDPEACSTEEPFAVKKQDDGEVVGCHISEEMAREQIAALAAAEDGERSRPRAGDVETRHHEIATDGKRIRGIVPFNVESRDMGGWKEIISPTALRNTRLDELIARVDHAGVPLARFPKTLTVEEKRDGLHWSLTPPESRQDVREAVERGDLRAGRGR